MYIGAAFVLIPIVFNPFELLAIVMSTAIVFSLKLKATSNFIISSEIIFGVCKPKLLRTVYRSLTKYEYRLDLNLQI